MAIGKVYRSYTHTGHAHQQIYAWRDVKDSASAKVAQPKRRGPVHYEGIHEDAHIMRSEEGERVASASR